MRRLLPLLLCALSLPVSAHQLWIEQSGGNAKLYYGEYGDNLRETSPGLLDKLPNPEARVVTLEGGEPVTLKKTANAFDLGVRATRGQVLIAQESSYPAWDQKDGASTKRAIWIPAARFVPDMGPQEPALALDVFPTRHSGEFKVVFTNRPLAEAKVELVGPGGWTHAVTTDAQGLFRVQLPYQGPYAVEVHHTDTNPGQRPAANGPEKYDLALFVTTLTFDQPTGPKAPPAPAKAASQAAH